MPEKLHELQRLWLIEATTELSISRLTREIEHLNADLAGRPAAASRAIVNCYLAGWEG